MRLPEKGEDSTKQTARIFPMMPFACTGCGCKLSVRRNVTSKQVKCPRCGAPTPLPHQRLEPMQLRPPYVPPPQRSAPDTTLEEPAPPGEDSEVKSTISTEEPGPGGPTQLKGLTALGS